MPLYKDKSVLADIDKLPIFFGENQRFWKNIVHA